MVPTVLITGASGYIGGTFLDHLLKAHKGEYAITAYIRNEKLAEAVKALGVTPLIGSYDTLDVLTKAVTEHDIIFHFGDSADHIPSAKAILEGLASRPKSSTPAIYIHTSGTGILIDDVQGNVAGTKIYTDTSSAEIDALPDTQLHRDVDVIVRDAAITSLEGKAKVTIVLPPTVYGVGSGPGKKITRQIPRLINYALKTRFAPKVGLGINYWGNIHVNDLTKAYVIILKTVQESDNTPWKEYHFTETGEHQWKDVYDTVGKTLFERGLIDSPIPENPGKKLGYDKDTTPMYLATLGRIVPYDGWGSNSRSRADRLKALGWKAEESDDVLASIPKELDAILSPLD